MEKIEFKDLNQKVETNNNLLIILSTEWCGQCKMAKLLVEKVKMNFENIVFIEIDVDDNDLWDNEQFNVKSVPTFIGYKNKKLIFNEQGYQTEDKLTTLLNKF